VLIPRVDRIREAVADAFTADPSLEQRRERLAAEGAIVWVLNGSGVDGQAAAVAGYLDFLGVAASAPNQPTDPVAQTTIVALNGAEAAMPETLALLESTLGVTATTRADPAATADFIVTTAPTTPALTPPPGP
jgi:hypothetical protein